MVEIERIEVYASGKEDSMREEHVLEIFRLMNDRVRMIKLELIYKKNG